MHTLAKNRWLELVPYVGGTAGNIVTDAYAGARVKLGYNLSRDWTVGISPVLMAATVPVIPARGKAFEFYVSFDGQGRTLIYNAFIDAATRHELDRRYLVADGGIGVGVRVNRLTAS